MNMNEIMFNKIVKQHFNTHFNVLLRNAVDLTTHLMITYIIAYIRHYDITKSVKVQAKFKFGAVTKKNPSHIW